MDNTNIFLRFLLFTRNEFHGTFLNFLGALHRGHGQSLLRYAFTLYISHKEHINYYKN
jgi:hypothetical protein